MRAVDFSRCLSRSPLRCGSNLSRPRQCTHRSSGVLRTPIQTLDNVLVGTMTSSLHYLLAVRLLHSRSPWVCGRDTPAVQPSPHDYTEIALESTAFGCCHLSWSGSWR